jgi:hypothetical protein
MTVVSPTQVNPNDEVTAASVNTPVNQLAATINGSLDDNNISALSGTKISSGTIPASKATTDANVETRLSESIGDFVASGCVWSIISGLNAAMTAGVVYIGGRRVVVAAISSQAFVASKGTYVSVDNTGAVSIASTVSNGAAAPALPASSLWLSVNVTSGAAVTAVKQFGSGASGTVIYPDSPTAAHRSWVPVWTNITVGNGTVTAKYKQVGKRVDFHVVLTLGSGSSVSSNPNLTLPVTAAAYGDVSSGNPYIGIAHFEDNAVGSNEGTIDMPSTTTMRPLVYTTGGTYAGIAALGSAVPFTWGTGDEIILTGSYEAA